MPIVEFECTNEKCKHVIEKIVITSQDKKQIEEVVCEQCKQLMRRIISLTGKGKVK